MYNLYIVTWSMVDDKETTVLSQFLIKKVERSKDKK